MQSKATAAIVFFAVALPLSAFGTRAHHRHFAPHHATSIHAKSSSAPRLAPVSADFSGHAFHMPPRFHRAGLRSVRIHSTRHAAIHFRAPYETTTGTEAPFAIDGWTAPYFVAYPAPIAKTQPAAATTHAVPQPPVDQASFSDADSSSRTAPAFEAAPASGPDDPPAPADEPGVAAVTIIFKDGRPAQQIRNYILTRRALFPGGDNQPAIPVEQLDLTATIKANEEAGIAFQLPPTLQ